MFLHTQWFVHFRACVSLSVVADKDTTVAACVMFSWSSGHNQAHRQFSKSACLHLIYYLLSGRMVADIAS